MQFSSAEIALNALKSLPKNLATLNHYRDTCDVLRGNIEGIGSPLLTDQPRGSIPAGTEGDNIAHFVDLLALAKIKERYYNDTLHAVKAILSNVKEPYHTILVDRYVLAMPWHDISLELGYSESHLYKLHRDALQAYALAFSTPE